MTKLYRLFVGSSIVLNTLQISQTGLINSCDSTSIPFSLEVLSDGQPVLRCSKAPCFRPEVHDSSNSLPKILHSPTLRMLYLNPQSFMEQVLPSQSGVYPPITLCTSGDQCPNLDQWVAGVLVNGSNISLECCQYPPLLLSSHRGCAFLDPGHIWSGGAVLNAHNHRLYAFDYISDLIPQFSKEGWVTYDVLVRRMPCLPPPPETTLPVDAFVEQDLLYYWSRARPRAFQAPLLDLDIQSNSTSTTTTTTTTSPQPAPEEEDIVGGGAGAGAVVPTSPRTPENNIQSPPTNSQNPQANPPQPAAPNPVAPVANPAAAASSGAAAANPVAPVASPAAAASSGAAAANPVAPVASPAAAASSGAAAAENPLVVAEVAQAPALDANPAIAASFRVADSPSFGGLAGGGGAACFTADTTVNTGPAGEAKRMDELRVGDWVMSLDANEDGDSTSFGWVRVEWWLHKESDKLVLFQRLQLEDGEVLKLTAKHFIYICSQQGERKAVLAEQVQVDDCLWVMQQVCCEDVNQPKEDLKELQERGLVHICNLFQENQEYQLVKKRVVDVSVVLEKGIYAPITSNGDILVNNVLASCYVLIQHNIIQQSFVKMLKEWSWLRWMHAADDLDEHQHLLPFGTHALVDLMAYLMPIK